MSTVLLFALGLVLLVLGAEALVRGASRLAVAVGVSPLVVGLTVVALGTSAPEMAVSVRSTLAGNAGLAVGNVVGSNIVNILLVLGISAVILPLAVPQRVVRHDVPLMIGVSLLLWLLARDGRIDRAEGLLLFLGAALYVVLTIYQSRRENAQVKQRYEAELQEAGPATPRAGFMVRQVLLVAAGLALLALGAHWLVEGAVAVARILGLSDLVIGLTVVAVGTSLPEIAATVMASLRGERDIAVGNAIGSNLLNILAVIGLTAVLAPRGLPVPLAALAFDIPVMTAVALACLPVFFIEGRIARWEGALFLGYFGAYTTYLLLASAQPAAMPMFRVAICAFVAPLTAVTLAVLAARQFSANRSR